MSVSCNPLKIITKPRCWQSSLSWQPSSWSPFRASSCTRPARSFPQVSPRGRPHQLRRTEGKERNTISELGSWLHRYLVVRVLAMSLKLPKDIKEFSSLKSMWALLVAWLRASFCRFLFLRTYHLAASTTSDDAL